MSKKKCGQAPGQRSRNWKTRFARRRFLRFV
jgi:hypothetical protein